MALNYEAMVPVIREISHSVARNFPPYVQASDAEGAIYLWLFEKKAWVEETVRDDPHNWERKISKLMRKVAFDHCNKEKAAAEGYDISDIYTYSSPKLVSMLPDMFDYMDWQTFGLSGDGQPGAKPQANTTGDRIAELVDIKAAYERLTETHQEIIKLHYQWNMEFSAIAEELDITEEAAKKRAQRALAALQKALGYKSQEEVRKIEERRTVKRNQSWNAQVSNQWDGN